ncbi:hypothetical protein, partial [Brevibacillus sp. IT-7CA2]|uniref:hypothetical protein n=1 Tax=Brevibacillus sp. IT-7CA2 TaxID=3026436 RepID=UPI0039DFDD6C
MNEEAIPLRDGFFYDKYDTITFLLFIGKYTQKCCRCFQVLYIVIPCEGRSGVEETSQWYLTTGRKRTNELRRLIPAVA